MLKTKYDNVIDEMNHSLEFSSINYSNSDQTPSPGASDCFDSSIGMNRDQSHSDSNDGAAKNDKQAMVPLHKDFFPGDHDVICGRGKKCYAHTGNERFRQIVQSHLEAYKAASSRPEKSEILSIIVNTVRKNSPDGGFVKQDTSSGSWYEVGDFLAREKTSQAFRDALHENYRSSKKSKHEKRRQRTQAKAMSEKHTSQETPVDEQGELRQVLDPSPLVSRQQLTVLREEGTHPRAFSFSGQSHEPRVHEVPARALSLSSGRGGRTGGRHDVAAGEYEALYGEAYHRADSAPSFYFGQQYSADDLVETGPRLWEQTDAGHESWPRPTRPSRSLFSPQFHPVRDEDVAAHRSQPDTDTIMAEVEGVRSHQSSAQTSRAAGEFPPRRQRKRDDSRRSTGGRLKAPIPLSPHSANPIAAPSSSSAGRYASLPTPSTDVAAIHERGDSNASVNVAQLASALQPESLGLDDNPFEPIPLAGRSKKKPKTEGGDRSNW